MESTLEDSRRRRRHSSYLDSSIDFPTYIPWNTLSTEYSGILRGVSYSQVYSNLYSSPTINDIPCDERTVLLNHSDHHEFINSHGEPVTGVTWYGAAFLLVNTALGAGILNYPEAYDRAGGILSGTLIQIVLLVLLTSTMIVLAYCADLNGDMTYHDVLLSTVGRRAQQLAAFSILLTCFGICVTFLIVIGDQFDRLFLSLIGENFCHSWYLERKFTITVFSTLLILPMCYPKRIDFLKYFSSLGVLTMLYTVFLVIYKYFEGTHEDVVINTKPSNVMDVFFILPIFCFAYQTHEVVVPVYSCMKKKDIKTFTFTVLASMVLLFCIYSSTGICGYLTFGSKVTSDVIKSYDANKPMVLIAIVTLTLKMVTTYPPLLLCGRGAIDGLYCEFRGLSVDEIVDNEKFRRRGVTTFWFILTLILAVFIPNIGAVLEVLGSLAAFNVFIFPGLCIIKIIMRQPSWQKSVKCYLGYLYGVLLILFGAFIFVVVLVHLIVDEKSDNESQICT